VKSLAVTALTTLLALGLGGCNRGGQSKEAVRAAILDHLTKRANINVSSMQVDVVSVTFREKEADATVSFRPKGADTSSPGMTMNYTLQRQGNGWVVKGRADSGSSPHGAAGQMPQGMMPPGHPPAGVTPPPETKK
jgi:hypothetical protein